MKKKTNIHPYTREFLRGNGGSIFLGILQILLSTAGCLMLASLLQQCIDLMSRADSTLTLQGLLLYSLTTMAVLLTAYLCEYCYKPRFISKAMGQYQNYAYGRLTEKGMASFSKEGSSQYISALSNDAASIETNYLSNVFALGDSVLSFTAALVMMFWYSPLLTLVSIGISFLPILTSLLTGGKAAQAEKMVSDQNEQYMASLQDSLMGFDVIKAFRAESQMRKLFAAKVQEVMRAKELRRKIEIIIRMLSTLSGALVQLGVFLVGAWLAISGKGITAGTVVLFVQLLNYVLQPIAKIPGYIAGIRSSRALIGKLAQALEENTQGPGTENKETLNTGIAVQNVSFGYDAGKPILTDVSCRFAAGKSYAIVGASGSGKSTLLHLLTASYRNYTGSICYDETELREICSDSLYDLLSIIQQNVFIFNASIRENITMFMDFPEKEISGAIRLSGLSSLIEDKGEGYLCGENGCNLSGGEKQRISIARSLLRKSQILLADEATAALDRETGYQVSEAILNLTDMTRIVVTHSLEASLLKRYDGILAMKAGKIVETGNFEDLMEKKGYFYSLYTVAQ